MSRRSERLVQKRKQSHTEYVEDLSKFGKRRKVEQPHLMDVTNESYACEFGHGLKQMKRSANSRLAETIKKANYNADLPAFFLPMRLSTFSNAQRRNPLPDFSWANSGDVWKAMLNKDLTPSLRRDPNLFCRHQGLDERMRSILLDWMIEVCEVYKMHRETFYMSVDYLDRYLSRTTGVKKSQLQLIGITALFVAAKMEEIYPARLAEFSYVTDGACTEEDILQQEIVMLKVLDWELSPVTAHLWLTTLYQASFSQNLRRRHMLTDDAPNSPLSTSSSYCGAVNLPAERSVDDQSYFPVDDVSIARYHHPVAVPATPSCEDFEDSENTMESWAPPSASANVCITHKKSDLSDGCAECFLHVPQFSQHNFIQIVRLLDLCILDSSWLKFSYSVLAASVLYYCLSAEAALNVSGYQWSDIEECVNWMAVKACVIQCQDRVELKAFARVTPEDAHNIQTHTVSLDLLDRAADLRLNSSRLSRSGSLPSNPEEASLKLPATVHPATLHSSNATGPSSVAMITPPNSHSRKSKHVVTEEDSGFGME